MSVFDSLTGASPRPDFASRPKVRFQWNRDENGSVVLPELPDIPPQVAADADELSVSYTQSETSINDDGSARTESVEVKAIRRRRSSAEVAATAPRPKWEENARAALRFNLKEISTPLTDLLERDANEGDTRMIVNEILVSGLGYDRFSEITTEHMIRGEFCDYGLKLNERIQVIVEVKRVGKKLVDRDIRQAETYALKEGVEWTVLTNGITWRLYHVTASVPTKLDLVFDVSLLGDLDEAVDSLYFLTRASLERNQVAALWNKTEATSPDAIREILLSESVVDEVRRELKRVSNLRLENTDVERLIADALH